MLFKNHFIALAGTLLVIGCGVKNPNLVGLQKTAVQPTQLVSLSTSQSAFFPLVTSEATFQQSEALTNETTVLLQIQRSGTNVRELTKEDFVLTENGRPVTQFDFAIEDTRAEQVVDIAFVVDVTQSMGPFIESAKARLTEFIRNTKSRGYHTRMCLSTFGDYTVQKCERFYDNDPRDTVGAQTEELISEIARLRSLRGSEDPGGRDIPENPMRALIDVGQAGWRPDAQKFVILVTDAAFLYSPGNEGNLESTRGVLPPTMAEVHASLESSQVAVMAVTPSLAGYNSNFQGVSSIVEKSNGEHFLFTSVMNRPAMLNDVLDRIISRVEATYRLTYNAEEFDANHSTLPLEQRNIRAELRDASSGQINDVRVSAQHPNGRPQYTSSWTISNRDVERERALVTVNETPVADSDYTITGGVIRFNTPPEPGSAIKVVYYYVDAYANLRLTPVSLNPALNESDLKITLNGIPARASDIQIDRDMSNNISITLLSSVAQDNHYKINDFNGIALRVE